ncbi:hypothetical protein [Glycocaulis sp.]|uniref:hypothetical protein n=1 Tax=Glycocaulis sp. TaxID=1969725 RepID=UPI0025BB0F6A|nr:hypothetical protein [Glycocaulis sp.]MCH8522474.1 hypothetical protein [Glycocaulis sp.]
MPSYTDTQSLFALNEAELRSLYAIIYEEMLALPEGSEAKAETEKFLTRIRNVITAKRQNGLNGPRPSL